MVELKSIARTSIQDEVFKQLMDNIISGKWVPGEKIPSEDHLAKALSVSRVTIRAATQRLSALGLVSVKQGGGTFIEKYTTSRHLNSLIPLLAIENKDIMHLMQLRKIIEVGIIEVVAQIISKSEIETLENIYEKMTESKDNSDVFAKYDSDFHLALADLSKNPLIVVCYSVISDIFSSSMKKIVDITGPDEGLYYHKEIINSLKQGDAKKAQVLMHEHIERTINTVSKAASNKRDTKNEPFPPGKPRPPNKKT